MSPIFITWILLCIVSLGSPIFYYLFMRRAASKPWKLKINKNYNPSLTFLIPMHNEEKTIGLKLENLYNIDYQRDKIQVILVNDCSNDKTLEEASGFIKKYRDLNITILNQTERGGKTKALNYGLKYATGDVVVVSDADCFLSTDLLKKSLPFLSDNSVGAITGFESLLNQNQTWVTKSENVYDSFAYKVATGESKVHSTLFFQGGFGAYKRGVLEGFDYENDDAGTALNVNQKKTRTLLVPEAVFYTSSPRAWKSKIKIKLRRANQLIKIYIRCFKLLLENQLALPKRIVLSGILLYLVNPFVFVLLIVMTPLLIAEHFIFFLFFFSIFLVIIAFEKTRILFVEFIQSMFILLIGFFTFMIGTKITAWKTVDDSRSWLTRDALETEKLIGKR